VQRLLNKLNNNAAKMWILGKWISINEPTLSFQGWSRIKLCISYKKEGDGFQCDAICNNGYTFSFFIRYGDPPPLPTKIKKFDLSPTAQCVVLLALHFPTFGHKFLWTTFSTPGSCSQCCTWHSVVHTELCECLVMAFHHW
jgi:hypothetical protein